MGKVFLARQRDDQALKIIREHGLPQFTQRSIVNTEDYLAELDQVRRQGYAVDEEEYLPGVKAVAVAVGNQRGLAPGDLGGRFRGFDGQKRCSGNRRRDRARRGQAARVLGPPFAG